MSKQGKTRSRASTFDELSCCAKSDTKPRSSRRCRTRSLDPTTIKQAKINQFDKHVEILEEQYIDKEINVPLMLQSSNCPNRSPRTVEMHQVQSIDTVDNIYVNRQRQVPRTGTAQWQDPGDVSCEATQVPMNQKMQKTVEIL